MPRPVQPKTVVVLLAGACCVLLTSCSRTAAEASGTHPADIPTIAVAKAEPQNLSHGLVLTAEFKPYQEIDVMAKVAGFVKEIKVDVGDRVAANQPLATLEVPEMNDDLQRAQAALDRSQADVQRAEDEMQRAQSAHEIAHLSYTRLAGVLQKKPGLIAQQEIDDAHGKDLVSEAQVNAARSARDAATEQVRVHKAELQKVKTMMEYTRVTAPFAGVVTQRYADTGAMIQAGTASQTQARPLVRLSQNSLLRLILPVPESAVPTVHIGQQVEVRVPTLKRSFPGRVARFAERLSLATRTMDTEVDVPNPNLVLIPGMYAEVDLTLARRNEVLAIPVLAVDMDSGDSQESQATGGHVMVVTPNNRVEVRRIQLGLETANRVEVRSGLNDGDLVVLSGRAGLRPGQEVRPKLTALAAAPR